ncbi:MAG: ABC transporter ATP-binding protein [Candidatus Bathyarchaeia archaeon]
MDKNEDLLVVDNLTKHFKTSFGVVRAVDEVSFRVRPGETFGLVGESGSGKSTTGYVIMGIYTPTSGKIFFKGKDISVHAKKRPKHLKKDMAIVFQDPASSLNPTKTVKDIVGLPLKIHGLVKNDDELERRVAELLEAVELPSKDFMQRRPRDLGGGERQAVAIARAIATNPSFIVLDEPTSALDVSIQAKIMKVLMRLQQELNLSYLFITHDLSLMRNVASRVAIMYLAKIVEFAPTATFFQNPLHPYTQMLLSSVPVLTDEEEKLKPKEVISRGEVPSAINPPPGCRFHTRCPFASEICKTKEPAFIMVEPDHYVACHLVVK